MEDLVALTKKVITTKQAQPGSLQYKFPIINGLELESCNKKASTSRLTTKLQKLLINADYVRARTKHDYII